MSGQSVNVFIKIIMLLILGQNIVIAGTDFEITKAVIANGSDLLQGGSFSLKATIGQFQTQQSSAGEFVLQGGFWHLEPNSQLNSYIFSDSFEF